MFLIHPILQTLATILAIYVLVIGITRFQTLHLGKKKPFNRPRHILLGKIAMIALLIGIIGGLAVTFYNWRGFFITGTHGKTGIFLAPLILFGLITGYYMDKKKKKRKLLPLIHGIAGLIVICMAFYQGYTGILTYRMFVLGV